MANSSGKQPSIAKDYMDIYQSTFIAKTTIAATASQHIFPKMAACEAALECGYGTSGLAKIDNNLFGMKQHAHPIFGTHNLPTKEFLDGAWVVVLAHWVHYPTIVDCFTDRMNTLRRLAPHYPHYAAALAATDPITYVTEVSKTWSTGPKRGAEVIAIYNAL
jgi:flagellum-specific peptidoglycan hydrolase FlgJ